MVKWIDKCWLAPRDGPPGKSFSMKYGYTWLLTSAVQWAAGEVIQYEMFVRSVLAPAAKVAGALCCGYGNLWCYDETGKRHDRNHLGPHGQTAEISLNKQDHSRDLRPRHIYFPQFSIGAAHPSPTAAAAAQPGGACTASTFPDRSHHLTTLRPRAPWQHFQALEVLDSECRFVPIPSSLASPDANRHHWQDQHFLSSLWNGRL